MRKRLTAFVMLVPLALLLVNGCSDDDTTTPETTSDFAGYEDWTLVEYTNTPSDFLGPAHQGGDPEYSRAIYAQVAKDGAEDGTKDAYTEGDIFVKATFTYDNDGNKQLADPMGLLGMIKREAGFDTDDGDWEYFNIDPTDLSTIASGADLGSCKGCHAAATNEHGNDYIFAHPYEFEATVADFADYANWHLIDTQQGADALLGDAHAGNDANAVRKTYKKQLAANPGENSWGYPVGTLLLKTVQDDQGNLIGKTAMAKRGAGFDAQNDDWEYFMWDVATDEIAAQGAVSMCIGCHTAANVSGNGTDYVFGHSGDPFND